MVRAASRRGTAGTVRYLLYEPLQRLDVGSASVIGNDRSGWAPGQGIDEHADRECEQTLCDPLYETSRYSDDHRQAAIDGCILFGGSRK